MKASEYIKARFVGGPKHNQVVLMPKLSRIEVFEPCEVLAHISDSETYKPPKISSYALFIGITEGGARYLHYVHESLQCGGQPPFELLGEPRLPLMPARLAAKYERKLLEIFVGWQRRKRAK